MRSRSTLPPVSKPIRFWKSSSAFVILLGVALGCTNPQAPGPSDVVVKPVDVQVTLPDPENESALALFNDDRALRIGDSEKRAYDVFPRPSKAYDDDELPQQVGGRYRAHTWNAATQSFGVITLDNRVVLAMLTSKNVSTEQFNTTIQRYTDALNMVEPKLVPGEAAAYWFWELGTQRLMICRAADYKGRITMTVALGDEKMMDLLRMNPVFAAKDQAQAAQILQQQRSRK